MSSTRYMNWDTPVVYRVIINVSRWRDGYWETGSTVMGPYPTLHGAKVTRRETERLYQRRALIAAESTGEKPWIVEARIQRSAAEWSDL